jgi:hypothetical protein
MRSLLPVALAATGLAACKARPPVVDAAPAATASGAAVDASPPPSAPRLTRLVDARGNTGAIAVDDRWVYWLDETTGLSRISKRDGGPPISLSLPVESPGCCGVLAADATSVFWTRDAAPKKGLWRTTHGTAPSLLSDGRADVGCITMDADAVYWMQIDGASWALGGSVLRAPKTGGTPKALTKIVTPAFGCIAVDDAHVYVAANNERADFGELLAVPKNGGRAKRLAKVTGPAMFVHVDAENVYWNEAESIKIARKTTGALAPPVSVPNECGAVAGMTLDDDDLYFTCSGKGPSQDAGTVWRAPKKGGPPSRIAEHQTHPTGIAVDKDFVFWALRGSDRTTYEDGGIARFAKR